jgi:hypothetical protein
MAIHDICNHYVEYGLHRSFVVDDCGEFTHRKPSLGYGAGSGNGIGTMSPLPCQSGQVS